ncbi:hypothetical protein OYE22_21235 [Streptomyces sp. 71268]|uniref:hypothetical protein n=1 Tax=Streptomyces sp. 71268 TaxID=3002640 RepID=UPI0023F82A35|nr:hypothetical protein [Streptomyces sp. 71268]WEV27436.1 hypothetical protein OYE22_21235 [Streptomyces sp. 71268]
MTESRRFIVGRGAYAVARVAVLVRAPAGWLWWLGVVAAGIGLLFPGVTGRTIGVLGGAALFLVALAVTATVRRKRYLALARSASRAGKTVILQDRAVSVRVWRRTHRWHLAAAFLLAVAASFAAPAAGGMLLAGVGVGLWWKALWIGRWEEANESLLWVRTDALPGPWAVGGPSHAAVPGYLTTGVVAGDARPGGAKRVVARAAR